MKRGVGVGLFLAAACSGETGRELPAFAERIPGAALLVVCEDEPGSLPNLWNEFELRAGREGDVTYWLAPDLEVGWPKLSDSPLFAKAWARLTPTAGRDWLYLDCGLATDAVRARLRTEGPGGLLALRALDACGLGDLGPLLLTRDQQQFSGWLDGGTSRIADLFRGRQAANELGGGDVLLEISLSLSTDVLLGIVDTLLDGTGSSGPFSMLLQAMPLRFLSDVRGLLVACDGRLWLRVDRSAFACEIGVRDRDAFEDLLDRAPAQVAADVRRTSEWRAGGEWLRLSGGASTPARPARPAPVGVFCLMRCELGLFPALEARDRRLVDVRWSTAPDGAFHVQAEAH